MIPGAASPIQPIEREPLFTPGAEAIRESESLQSGGYIYKAQLEGEDKWQEIYATEKWGDAKSFKVAEVFARDVVQTDRGCIVLVKSNIGVIEKFVVTVQPTTTYLYKVTQVTTQR